MNEKTKRRKNPSGSIIFYVATINIADKEIEFSKKDLEHMDMFNALIEEENARISDKYQNAHKNKERDAASAKVINEMANNKIDTLNKSSSFKNEKKIRTVIPKIINIKCLTKK